MKKRLLAARPGRRRGRHRRALPGRARATGGSARCSSSSATSGSSVSFVFYDALLPHVARPERDGPGLDRRLRPRLPGRRPPPGAQPGLDPAPAASGCRPAPASTRGRPRSRPGSPSSRWPLWWVVFSMPLFRRVREPPAAAAAPPAPPRRSVRDALAPAGHHRPGLRRYPQAALLLVAFLVYNDGIDTIIRMATVYGTEIGIGQRSADRGDPAGAVRSGFPSPSSSARLAGRHRRQARDARSRSRSTRSSRCVGYFMTDGRPLLRSWRSWWRWCRAAPRRSPARCFASHDPAPPLRRVLRLLLRVREGGRDLRARGSSPLAVWLTGSSRAAILSVIAFFAVGGWLLWRVDVEAGQRAARLADEAAGVAT